MKLHYVLWFLGALAVGFFWATNSSTINTVPVIGSAFNAGAKL